MSTSVTLDEIRAAADAKYGSYDIALDSMIVRLLNPLRLPKANRDALVDIQCRLDVESTDAALDLDQEALLAEAITTIAETPTQAEALLAAIGGDLAVLAEVFEGYLMGTQAGEASASAA